MQKRLYFLLFALHLYSVLGAQTGCPGCVINLPALPEDTIYLGPAPDGVAGEYYDGDISFRMPKTTTPVNATDPSTPAGLDISKITIISAVNLPPGLSWEASQLEFNPDDQTDGCVKFCGTPLQPGLYEVEVFVTAEVLLINQSTSFTFDIFIAPPGSSNDGFSMQNSFGCGEVSVSFENNLPSNGNSGYSYAWDFGNGQSSTAENPGTQEYNVPGVYEVNYQASIDTFGYMLTTVQVLEVGCGDLAIPPIFNGAPDLYVKVKDPQGNFVYIGDVVDNAPVPFAFTLNLPIQAGNYSLEIRDDDTFNSEGCGTVNFNQTTAGTLQSGDMVVELDIIHPVFTVHSTDTVFVFANPDPPAITPDGNPTVCQGEEIELVSSYTDNIQWYQDTTVLFGETNSVFITSQPGSYWVEYTSPEGCKSQSVPVEVNFAGLPYPPSFFNNNNLLTLNDSGLLPADYSLQWFQDGNLIPGETDTFFCITTPGTFLYSLVVTDNATGCTNQFSIGASYNPASGCGLSAVGNAMAESSLQIFPNPTSGNLKMQFETIEPLDFDLQVLDGMGKLLHEEHNLTATGHFHKNLEFSGLPSGVYFLKIQTHQQTLTRKVIKE